MKKLGRTCLLLDVDGVLRDLAWRRGLDEFLRWAWATFDLVALLTAHREFIYESWPGTVKDGWPCPPSLAWKDSKTEPLSGLLRQRLRLFWAEGGATQSEQQWCRRHDDLVHYVECRGAVNLDVVRERILRAMAEARR